MYVPLRMRFGEILHETCHIVICGPRYRGCRHTCSVGLSFGPVGVILAEYFPNILSRRDGVRCFEIKITGAGVDLTVLFPAPYWLEGIAKISPMVEGCSLFVTCCRSAHRSSRVLRREYSLRPGSGDASLPCGSGKQCARNLFPCLHVFRPRRGEPSINMEHRGCKVAIGGESTVDASGLQPWRPCSLGTAGGGGLEMTRKRSNLHDTCWSTLHQIEVVWRCGLDGNRLNQLKGRHTDSVYEKLVLSEGVEDVRLACIAQI
ncbi:hypothetical protein CC86DRAFT_79017 [Ophiobolus disseminans]|uniref:Uncharacterized protein n=1 Tax=Ophiobolus disseminans TaxID=1469910 RepID=A0A6A6ZN00_9PLEO|nr:hypothetical protein CC86DRAFT_79017 [Ophiobolus disseminans]